MALSTRPNLAQEIADHLAERIIRMDIKPGERIMEAHVAEELEVSRSPVREAMHILERYQLVELIPRRGARVTEFSTEHIRCLFEIMTEIARLVARRAIENREIKELDSFVHFFERALKCADADDLEGYFESIYGYALALMEASCNPLLGHMLRDWLPSVRRIYFLSLSHSEYNLRESVNILEEFNECVVLGQSERAEQVVEAYLDQEQERIVAIAEQRLGAESGFGKDSGPYGRLGFSDA
ncbi:MAG: GntR family transcriptional regulator [Desulfatibacillaceae bacterium]